ncbi:MAG TPA: hypothetical protein VGL51_11005 [Solirubrobacteraceae bacterium]
MKSSPELWAECSDAASLARHLGQFGEIRITKLEPETAVAWEGSAASGTVKLEPSGWGTRVTLTVTSEEKAAAEPAEPAEPVEHAEPVEPVKLEPEPTVAEAEPPPQPVGLARLLSLFRRRPVAEPPDPGPQRTPEPTPEPPPKAEPPKARPPSELVLTAALDSLGQAHHRPYSRA